MTVDAAGPAEAAEILGVPERRVRARTESLGVPHRDLRSMRVWRRSHLRLVRMGPTVLVGRDAVPPDVVGLFEAWEIVAAARPRLHRKNARRFMEGRGLNPLDLKAGPVWNRRDVEALAATVGLADRKHSSVPRETCRNGHRLTAGNTIVKAGGVRQCRTCHEEARQRYLAGLLEGSCPRCGAAAHECCVGERGGMLARPHAERAKGRTAKGMVA